MSLIDDVRRTIQQHDLTQASTRVVAALSGGPDSTALLLVLRELHDVQVLRLAGVAHLNHQLRAEADADQRHCAALADSYGLPFFSERADVRAVAKREHRSIEDAAHHVRHQFFARAVSALAADVIATGHTMDDQAETFLLRLVRGAGTRGMAAMWPRRGRVIRPLLGSSRQQVRAFLDVRGVASLADVSNDDLTIPRNRVRAELLPLLTARFNPRSVETLAAEADLAREDQAYFEPLVDAWTARHVSRSASGTIRVVRDELVALPRAIGRRVLHTLMSEAAGGLPVSKDHVLLAWTAVVEQSTGFDGPRHRVERIGVDVVLTSRPEGSRGRPDPTKQRVPVFSRPLEVPGDVALPEVGSAMSAEIVATAADAPLSDGLMAVVPKDKVAQGLLVRSRRTGDRLKPSAAGHKKLQDLFVDRKVPRVERDRVPIVTDREGRIVWVPGHAIDTDFRVSDPAQAVVILRLKAVGGSS